MKKSKLFLAILFVLGFAGAMTTKAKTTDVVYYYKDPWWGGQCTAKVFWTDPCDWAGPYDCVEYIFEIGDYATLYTESSCFFKASRL